MTDLEAADISKQIREQINGLISETSPFELHEILHDTAGAQAFLSITVDQQEQIIIDLEAGQQILIKTIELQKGNIELQKKIIEKQEEEANLQRTLIEILKKTIEKLA